MALKTIKIRVRPGPDGKRKKEIKADVRGLFAYHSGIVTHAPTGYSTGTMIGSKAEAMRFIGALNSQKGWNFSTLAEFTKRKKRMIKQWREARAEAARRTS